VAFGQGTSRRRFELFNLILILEDSEVLIDATTALNEVDELISRFWIPIVKLRHSWRRFPLVYGIIGDRAKEKQ